LIGGTQIYSLGASSMHRLHACGSIFGPFNQKATARMGILRK
jgi:hypothetical protein